MNHQTKAKQEKAPVLKGQTKKQTAIVVAEKTRIKELIECDPYNTSDFLPVLREVISDDLIQYQWNEKEEMFTAMENLEGMLIAKERGLLNQFALHQDVLMTRYEHDQMGKAVRIMREYSAKAKPFSFSPDMKKGEDYIVKGKKKDWLLVDIEKTNKIVPTHALRQLNELERHGLYPYDIRVAYALKPEKTSGEIAREVTKRQATLGAMAVGAAVTLPAALAASILALPLVLLRDPVLAVSFGPHGFYVEIYRWDE